MIKIDVKTAMLLGLLGLVAVDTVAEEVKQEKKKPDALSEKEVFLLQKKTQALIGVLVNKGIIDADTARRLTNYADQEAAKAYGEATDVVPESQKDQPIEVEPNVVRVPYVSSHIRDQIRDQVKAELEAEVMQAIMDKAGKERWGVPDSWPTWVRDITMYGDVTYRFEATRFSYDNSNQYFDINAINDAGGTIPAGVDAFMNTLVEQDRQRLKAQLGAIVALSENWEMGIGLATGDPSNPVSQTVTLSNYLSNIKFNLNKAYIAYGLKNSKVTFRAGKFSNPWLHTDLVWDSDLDFNGLALTVHPMLSKDPIKNRSGFDPYFTVGTFPIEEIELSKGDKWLHAAQIGLNYGFDNSSSLKLGLAYYNYDNIEGEFNTFGSELLDYTAPQFVQKGNTLFDIRNDDNVESQRAALASDYNMANFTVKYDIANFAPIHIELVADYVKNIGFNADERMTQLEDRTGLDFNAAAIEENTEGYQYGFVVGHDKITSSKQWQFSIMYKYLESDAVLDSFTDSDFHKGGTDGKGYIVSGKYSLSRNIWLSAKLLSSNEINGAPLGIDIWQFNLSSKF